MIAPGIIDTPMMDRFSGGTEEGRQRVIGQEPVGRMGRPEEIAAAVLWLCSDLGSFTVGHAYVMDGGQTVGFEAAAYHERGSATEMQAEGHAPVHAVPEAGTGGVVLDDAHGEEDAERVRCRVAAKSVILAHQR